MADRSGPSDGYNNRQKDLQRRQLWNEGRRSAPPGDALLMPSIEGLEIDIAVAKGFRSSSLHVVDRNAAIVATLKRRHPRIQTYGVDVSRACERIAGKRVRLGFAHLDFCSNFSWKLIRSLATIGTTCCWADKAIIAVTLLRGRESAGVSFAVDLASLATKRIGSWINTICSDGLEFTERDHARAALVASQLLSEPFKAGIYKSPTCGQTMLWVLCRRRSFGSEYERTRAFFAPLEFLLAGQAFERANEVDRGHMKGTMKDLLEVCQ